MIQVLTQNSCFSYSIVLRQNVSHQRYSQYFYLLKVHLSWMTVNKATAHLASKQSLLDHWLCMHENGAPETRHPERLPWRDKHYRSPRATDCQRAKFDFCFKCHVKSEPKKNFTAEKVGHLFKNSPLNKYPKITQSCIKLYNQWCSFIPLRALGCNVWNFLIPHKNKF